MEEIDELEKMILNQPKKGRFLEIFNRSHLRRTMIVALANFFQQATGQSFSSQYGTLFVKSLNSVNPWAFNMGNNAVNVGGIILCLLLSDRIGRR
jgi:MFS transporter, SP family, sugar:H+ symporter